MEVKIFEMLNLINSRLDNIEKNIARIDEKLEFSIQLQRNHLIRTKNKEEITDEMILYGRPYNDLSPDQAYKIFNNANLDYIFLDVSAKNFNPISPIEGAIEIPFDELERRYSEIYSKTTPILIISAEGVTSIRASELLIKKGFFNVNNISGGHKFWPGHKRNNTSAPSDTPPRNMAV